MISLLKLGHTYFIISAKTKLNTNGQNNNNKVKKPTLSSHPVSVNYSNILVDFCVTNNEVKAALIVLSSHSETNTFGQLDLQLGSCTIVLSIV